VLIVSVVFLAAAARVIQCWWCIDAAVTQSPLLADVSI